MSEPWSIHAGPFERPGLRSADALIDGLPAMHRQVITFDLPGSGRSTRAAHLGMQEMHDCADEALVANGVVGPLEAVGHSMAGLALPAYAIERAQCLKRLVLPRATWQLAPDKPHDLWRFPQLFHRFDRFAEQISASEEGHCGIPGLEQGWHRVESQLGFVHFSNAEQPPARRCYLRK